MMLRFLGAFLFACSLFGSEIKVEADNRVVLKCEDTQTPVNDGHASCYVSSVTCIIHGSEIANPGAIHHPSEASVSRCVVFRKTTLRMLPAEFLNSYSSLQYISFSNIKLVKISDFSFTKGRLESLDLSHNAISFLSDKVFEGATSLKDIDLSHNIISRIEDQTFVRVKSLIDLNLSHNQLHNDSFGNEGADWVERMDSLKSLDLSYNKIFNYEVMPYQAFSGLVNLETLKLRGNQLTLDYGVFSSNQKLKTLDLSYNDMTYFELSFLISVTSLETLILHGNGITYASQVDLSDVKIIFPHLRTIGLSENTFLCKSLGKIVLKMASANIKFVIDEGKYVNHRRNMFGVECL